MKLCLFALTFFSLDYAQGNETDTGYWTSWYDEDSPRVGIGDVETIETMEKHGSAVCDKQYLAYSAECRTHVFDDWLVFKEKDAYLAPDKLYNPCTKTGVECRNIDQPMEATCRDYQVRFFCVRRGKDIIKEDNSSMIALAAGMTFLFPIILALIINVCKRYCCNSRQTQPLPVVSRDSNTLDADQKALSDPPPSYNVLFGHPQSSSSTENLLVNASTNTDIQRVPNQISIHTLPSSNTPPANSITVAEADSCNRQFQEGVKKFPGMHLSVMDMYHQYYDSNSTPPPSYNDALVILANVPKKPDDSENKDT